jgi:hypothetical protein
MNMKQAKSETNVENFCIPPRNTSPHAYLLYFRDISKGFTALCWTLVAFSVSWSFYTDSMTPWTGDQPVARPLPTHRTAQTQNKRTDMHISSGIRTHDFSVWAGENSSCLRPSGHYDQKYRSQVNWNVSKHVYDLILSTNCFSRACFFLYVYVR